jgi:hypothetical protein
MGKTGSNRKRIKDNLKFNTSYYKKKLNLIKHLQKTKLDISETLANDLLSEEIRPPEEVINDLEPSIIPHTFYPAEQLKNFKTSHHIPPHYKVKNLSSTTSSNSTNIEDNNNFNQYRPFSFHRMREKYGHSRYKNSSPASGKTTEFIIPTIKSLEETELKEFYNSFSNNATWQISNLNLKPGDNHFLFWFFSSSYIPLLCSCSGPLSNIFSLLAIICPWKIHKIHIEQVPDPIWCYLVNSFSSAFAIASNLFLILNYRKKVRYTYCQIISISGWGIASIMLTTLIIVYHWWFYHFHYNEHYIIGEGFWFAVITVVLHFVNFVMLLINELGFLLKKYRPLFNIDETQETLVIQTTSICVWLMLGAAVFSHILDIRLGEAFYYCVGSVVTVGMQDFVPIDDPLAQTLTSLWIIFGLVMFGLIISSIRHMMIEFSKSTLYWNRLELLRRKLLKAHRADSHLHINNQFSFKLIKNIHRWAFTIQGVFELISAITVFMITLMCGALAFTLFERWSYKLSVYFCFYNLMTLGQGSQTPITPGGRTFYCVWALGAIPVMTILVSTSSDFIFSKLTKMEQFAFSDAIIEFCISQKYLRGIGNFLKEREVASVDRKTVSLMRTQSMIKTKEYNSDDSRGSENTEKSSSISIPTRDSVHGIPLVCHPADMLYNVLLNSNGISHYDFISSNDFVRTNTAAIQLANYFREGTYIDMNTDHLTKQRRNLGERFKEMDSKFDIDRFNEVYDIKEGSNSNDNETLSVIQEGNIIKTSFKRKNDFVLLKLSKMQLIILKMRNALLDVCVNPDRIYGYEDWETLFKITENQNYLNDPFFWIESRSPLSFPMNQPKYFVLHYLRHIELFLQQFAFEWDEKEDK